LEQGSSARACRRRVNICARKNPKAPAVHTGCIRCFFTHIDILQAARKNKMRPWIPFSGSIFNPSGKINLGMLANSGGGPEFKLRRGSTQTQKRTTVVKVLLGPLCQNLSLVFPRLETVCFCAEVF
jgi:hypothetical protein